MARVAEDELSGECNHIGAFSWLLASLVADKRPYQRQPGQLQQPRQLMLKCCVRDNMREGKEGVMACRGVRDMIRAIAGMKGKDIIARR